jgi:hypothetical protein
MGYYKIVEAQLPIVMGLAGHDLLAVLNPAGQVIQEFEGLATSSSGQIKPIGYLPSDTLKVYEFNGQYNYNSNESQALVVSSTTLAGLQPYINAMVTCKNDMNSENLSYPFLGLGANSNSVASTLDACMGVPEPFIPNSALITPGVGTLLLPASTISSVQTANGLNQTSTAGDNYVSGESTGATTSTVDVSNSTGTSQVATITELSGANGSQSVLTDKTAGGAVQYSDVSAVLTTGFDENQPGGNGATVSAVPGDPVLLAPGANATIIGEGGDSIGYTVLPRRPVVPATANVDSSGNVINMNGSDTLNLGSSTRSNKVIGNDVTITEGADSGAILDDSNSNITLGTLDVVEDGGLGNVISASSDEINLAPNESVTVTGSNDKIVGTTGDTINLTGTTDDIYADSSTIEITGADTGDTVFGSGDSGDRSDWGSYVNQGGGYGGYGGGGYYDATRSIKPFPKSATISPGVTRKGLADIEAIGAEDYGVQMARNELSEGIIRSNNAAAPMLDAAASDNSSIAGNSPTVQPSVMRPRSSANSPQSMADQLIQAMATWSPGTTAMMNESHSDDAASSYLLAKSTPMSRILEPTRVHAL